MRVRCRVPARVWSLALSVGVESRKVCGVDWTDRGHRARPQAPRRQPMERRDVHRHHRVRAPSRNDLAATGSACCRRAEPVVRRCAQPRCVRAAGETPAVRGDAAHATNPHATTIIQRSRQDGPHSADARHEPGAPGRGVDAASRRVRYVPVAGQAPGEAVRAPPRRRCPGHRHAAGPSSRGRWRRRGWTRRWQPTRAGGWAAPGSGRAWGRP